MEKNLFSEINEILMNEDTPSFMLNKLKKEGQFKYTSLNSLDKLSEIEQNKEFHPEGNVWNHINMVVDNATVVRELANDKEALMWSALLHDIGKLTTTKMIRGKLRSYNHDVVGEEMVYNILKNEYSKDFAYKVSKLVRYHMHHIYILNNLPFKDMNGLIKETDLNDIILLFYSDKMGRGKMNGVTREKVFKDMYLILDKIEKYKGESFKTIRRNISLVLQ